MDKTTIGQRIKSRRKEIGIKTQSSLAALTGVTQATVNMWENDKTIPDGDNRDRLCEALQITWGDLKLGNLEDPYINTGFISHRYKVPLEPSVPLVDRKLIPEYVRGDIEINQTISARAVEKSKLDNVFAFKEELDGLAPMISARDIVFVETDTPLEIGRKPALFIVNERPLLGIPREAGVGTMITFYSKEPGWDSISIDQAQYIGMVIALAPDWLNS